MNKCLLTITVSALSLACSNFAVAGPLDNTHIYTHNTLELKPISSLENSYKTAASVFLPDADDGFGFGGSKTDNSHENSSKNCKGFSLSSCPAHAKCLKCTFGSKYKITGCETDYKQSGNTCVAKNCSEINAAYKAEIPANQVCSIINTSVRTCYSSCRAVNTSGYPLDACPSGAVCTPHPDCGTTTTAKGNCSPLKQKITSCTSSTQKINPTATACIDKDDTCPATYYKSCDTGTQGTPKYTEKGSACYQCKPKSNCGNEYIYDENNCPSNQNFHCSTACENKYKDCKPALFTGTVIKKNNMYYATDEKYCPGTVKRFVIWGNTFYKISSGVQTYYACTTADQTCADLAKSLYNRGNSNNTEAVSLTKDIYCGNEMLRNENNWYGGVTTTINGNGHTITFDKPTGIDIYLPGDGNKPMGNFIFKNVKIVSKTSGAIDADTDVCNLTNGSSSRAVFKRSSYYNDQIIILEDSTVTSQSDVGNPVYRGACTVNGIKK